MPTYEYACKSCGQHLEAVQSFTDDSLTVCPACGGQLRKVFGNIGIAFKGSGFYKNDSRSSKSSHVANGSSGGQSGASTEGGSSSESPSPSKEKEPAGSSSSKESSGSSSKESSSSGSSSGSDSSGSSGSSSKDSAKTKPSAAAS